MLKPAASSLAAIPLLLLATSCAEQPVLAPGDDAALGAPLFAHGAGGRQILMMDACDPTSFNLALGPGTCTRPARGGIPFSTFVSLLERHGQVEAWRFSPAVIHVTRTTTFTVPNTGGIPHSFTEVEEFGGGFVEFLNDLSGNPDPAPECLDFTTMVLVPPGGHDVVTIEPGESKKYMCCIHPWMRAETH